MTKFLSKSALAAVALVGSAFVSTSAMATDGCNGLSGYYGSSTAIVVSEKPISGNKYDVGIVMVNGGRPNAYGTCEGATVSIDFKDDHLISGTHNGTTISWNNNTSWTKQ